MRASEFIKKFGWDRAKREVALIGTIAAMCCDDRFNDDLKHLVESWELVESYGGLHRASKILKKSYMSFGCMVSIVKDGKPFQCTIEKFEQAIKDVESCQ